METNLQEVLFLFFNVFGWDDRAGVVLFWEKLIDFLLELVPFIHIEVMDDNDSSGDTPEGPVWFEVIGEIVILYNIADHEIWEMLPFFSTIKFELNDSGQWLLIGDLDMGIFCTEFPKYLPQKVTKMNFLYFAQIQS